MLRIQIVVAVPCCRSWLLRDLAPLVAPVAQYPVAEYWQVTDELHRLGSYAHGNWTSVIGKAFRAEVRGGKRFGRFDRDAGSGGNTPFCAAREHAFLQFKYP